MSDLKLNDVNLVLVDHRSQVRNSLRMALNEAGLRNNNIKDGGDLSTIAEAMQASPPPDIIICDVGMKGGDVLKMFRAIRHNDIGQNPFLGIIAISWDPTASLVDRVVDSGVDYLVAAPFAPQQIIDRVRAMVYNRAPFVVTSEYIGPDRRDGRRGIDQPLLEVPNSLRAKVLGEFDGRRMRKAIDETVGVVNGHKMERHAYSLAENSALLAHDYSADYRSVDPTRLEALSASATDLRRRAQAGGMTHVAELCEALQNVLNFVRTTPPEFLAKEIELLKQLSFAIRGAVDLHGSGTAVVHDIASTVTRRDDRKGSSLLDAYSQTS